MSPSLDQIDQALQAAHKSGNEDDAYQLAKLYAETKAMQDAPRKESLTWGQVPLEAALHVPESFGNLVAGVAHPIDAAQTLLDAANGGLQKSLPDSIKDFMHKIAPNTVGNEEKASAVADFYKNRYGTEQGFKEALAYDPVGVIADLSSVLGGIGSVASKSDALANIGSKITSAGTKIDPIIAASKAVSSGIVQPIRTVSSGMPGVVGNVLTRAGQDIPQNLSKAIKDGNITLVKGAEPTTTQAVMNPGISQLERTVRNIGYNPMIEKDKLQNSARIDALNNIEGIGNLAADRRESGENAGHIIRREFDQHRGWIKDAERGAFNDPVLDNLNFTVPKEQIRAAIEQYYPGATYEESPSLLRRIADAENTITHQELQKWHSLTGNLSRDLMNIDPAGRAAALSVKHVLSGIYDKAKQTAEHKLAITGDGVFGRQYGNLAGDMQNSMAHLLNMGQGEVPAAGVNAMAGPISMVAGEPVKKGSGAFGLMHVDAQGRNDVLQRLPSLINEGIPYSRLIDSGNGLISKSKRDNSLFLGDGKYEALIRKDFDGNPAEAWNHTAYKVKAGEKLPVGVSQIPAVDFTPTAKSQMGTTGRNSIDQAFEDLLLESANKRQPVAQPEPVNLIENPRAYLDVMPPKAYKKLEEARALTRYRKDRFDKGPSFNMTQTGRDGMPQLNGAEIPEAYFNSKASQAADIGQFAKSLPGNDDAWQALRNYALSDLLQASQNKNGDLLHSKFSGWTKNRSQALKGLLSQNQFDSLDAVGSDLARADEAANLGRAIGSNTAQNQFGFGILSSPVTTAITPKSVQAANKIAAHLIGKKVGEALLNPDIAKRSLEAYGSLNSPNGFQNGLLLSGRKLANGKGLLEYLGNQENQ